MVALSNPAFAVSTASVPVRAIVPSGLELTYWIQSAPPGVDPYGAGSAAVTSMDFGTLTYDQTNGIYLAGKYFTVFLIGRTAGSAYRLQQTCNGFTTTGGSDLNNNLMMTPDYKSQDAVNGIAQGAMPAGDSFTATSLAFATNKVIYNGNAGVPRIVRAYYGLATGAPGEPAGSAPITDKPAGTYNGTVTFSVVLQ